MARIGNDPDSCGTDLVQAGFSFHGGGQTPHMFSTPLSDCPLGKKESDGIKSNAKSLERGSCQLF